MKKIIHTLLTLLTLTPINNSATPYKILGSSSKFTKKQTQSMLQWRTKIVKLAEQNPDTIIINTPTTQKTVALTFDDGPDKKITPQILDLLKKNKIKATFFFIGNQIEKNKDIVKRAHQEGHLVLNHSFSHPKLSQLTPEKIKKEIERTEQKLNKLIGPRPLLMRPPYGDVNDTVLKTLKSKNYKIVLWSLDTCDYSDKHKEAITNTVLKNTRPGEIILMHNNADKRATYQALPTIIKKLRDRGYRFINIDKI